MSFTALKWSLALHVFGVILWMGAMVALAFLLSSEAAKKDSPLLEASRKIARVMDIGALIAIVCGIYILARTKAFGDAWALKQPWMHIKLTVVVIAAFGGHGFVAATLGRIRRGAGRPLPSFVAPLVLAAAFGIVVLAIVKPLAKGG